MRGDSADKRDRAARRLRQPSGYPASQSPSPTNVRRIGPPVLPDLPPNFSDGGITGWLVDSVQRRSATGFEKLPPQRPVSAWPAPQITSAHIGQQASRLPSH